MSRSTTLPGWPGLLACAAIIYGFKGLAVLACALIDRGADVARLVDDNLAEIGDD